MWKVYQRLAAEQAEKIDDEVVLNHLQRERGRFKTTAISGVEVQVFLERGQPLMIGDVLRSHCAKNIAVVGALESVAIARTDDWNAFSKACYHLGNRHTKIQLGERWLRITPDHVLEELLQQLGLNVSHERAVFEPEPGAYGRRGVNASHLSAHSHGHGHSHDHSHRHSHSHSHSHSQASNEESQ